VSGGGLLAQKLLAQGGMYGYLGAAGIAAGSLTLDMMNQMYGQHYTRPYSERRGARAGEILFDNFGTPTLAAERALNSLEGTSMNERSSTNVVSAFSKAVKATGLGTDQILQENTALGNYMRDLGQFVVPH